MKRSRGFILSEILMTMMLQAGFILTLFGAFYLMMEFYTKTQAMLTARDHAERVIQFVDDKIRAAGLGLWRCNNSAEVRARLSDVPILKEKDGKGYKLPVALTWYNGTRKTIPDISTPEEDEEVFRGDILNLLYAQRDLTTLEIHELVMLTDSAKTVNGEGTVTMIDSDSAGRLKYKKNASRATSEFLLNASKASLRNYAVSESVGVPFFLKSVSGTTLTLNTNTEVTIPAAAELMYLKFIQIFVHDKDDGEGRQFAFSELDSGNYDGWGDEYNQEKNILDIYMELDTSTNIFTLYVLAQGGYDAGVTNPRPSKELWPYHANPIPEGKTHDDEISDEEAENAWKGSKYCHYTVYVSRASWKLNNIPEGFSWN